MLHTDWVPRGGTQTLYLFVMIQVTFSEAEAGCLEYSGRPNSLAIIDSQELTDFINTHFIHKSVSSYTKALLFRNLRDFI